MFCTRKLYFRPESRSFAKKRMAMKTLDEAYAAFERLMDEAEIFRNEALTFDDICREAGADPAALEKVLRDELGYSGRELVDFYRRRGKNP